MYSVCWSKFIFVMSVYEIHNSFSLLSDISGGTVDITVHQVVDSDKLREIDSASGGAWGGTMVDEAFKRFLIRLVGKKTLKSFMTILISCDLCLNET